MSGLKELIGKTTTIEEIKRLISILEKDDFTLDFLQDYEQKCIEFLKFFKKDIDFMWEDEWFKRNFNLIERFSLSDEPILLIRESGTGKEIISRLIHFLSKRNENVFYPINCSSQSDETLQSELFGHERGAYTSADRKREGRLKTSDGGTVFLDEIQTSSHKFQQALLRFLDYKEIQPLGSDRIERADVRIITACCKKPKELLKEGKLLEHFYYRISALKLYIPPLRERKDIKKYIYYFLLKECLRLGKEEKEISYDALEALKKYPWPGNLREMRNVIHSLVLLNEDNIIKIDALLEEIKNYKGEVIHSPSLNYPEEDFTQWNSYKIFLEMKEEGKSFEEVVWRRYFSHELNKYQLREIIKFGLKESEGSLKGLLPIFKIKERDYKKFHDFLRKQGIRLKELLQNKR